MSLRILVDMNLSIEWITILEQAEWQAVHWSAISDPQAEDRTIISWAQTNGYVVFTHDLDFGTALALTHAGGLSVVQVRGQRVLPEHIGSLVLEALRRYEEELSMGALIILEQTKTRARILPL